MEAVGSGLRSNRGGRGEALSSPGFESYPTGSLRQQDVDKRRHGPRTERWTRSRSRRQEDPAKREEAVSEVAQGPGSQTRRGSQEEKETHRRARRS